MQSSTLDLPAAFQAFVIDADHPCVMARSAVNRGNVRFGVYVSMSDARSAARTCNDLYQAAAESAPGDGRFISFVAAFPNVELADERAFEAAMWSYLRAMHAVDARRFEWDEAVSSDPSQTDFSFSIGGVAWFVVGMHPHASRLARRFEVPLLIFNPHAQFEQLRVAGKFDSLRDRIRERDRAGQGDTNPMMNDHGVKSEARQYSGRATDAQWQCPFAADR